MSESSKVKYVQSEAKKGTKGHHCHYPGCGKPCPPAMWGCTACWYKLPKFLRDRIWRAFKPGQEKTKTPSREYVKVAKEVQAWIEKNG